MRNKKHTSAVSKQARTKNNTIVRFRVRFSFFCSNHKKGKKRPSTTNDAHTIIIGLSLSLLPLTTRRHRRTRKEETKNHIVQSLLRVKLRVKETKRVRACPLLLLFASFQTTREFDDDCFFLRGCETTTAETLFRPSLFLCDDGSCSSLPRRARARERERQTYRERERHASSFFRNDAFRCVFSKRGVKNSIVIQKMMMRKR